MCGESYVAYVDENGDLIEHDCEVDDNGYLDDYDEYLGNMHCDTYGVCGGYNCPNYFKCNAN